MSDDQEFGPLSPTKAYRRAYPVGRLALRLALRLLAPRLRATGRQHVPLWGPVLLAPNHLSDLDPPFVFNAVHRPLWFMAKQELFEMEQFPWLGPVMRFCQAFPVDPGEPDRAALRHAERLLKRGRAVVIFPEGRLSHTGAMGPVLPGVTMIALRAGAPVIPVGLHGTTQVLPYGALRPRPTLAPVRLHFGPPLDFADLASLPRREQREVATDRLETALSRAVAAAQST